MLPIDKTVHMSLFLTRVVQTVCEMLHDRGGYEADVEHFRSIIGEELSDVNENTLTIDSLNVRLVIDLRDKLNEVKSFANQFIESSEHGVYIIIFKTPLSKLSRSNLKFLEDLSNETRFVQTFDVKELSMNISTHVLVPKHEIVPDRDIPELLQELNAQEQQLPAILRTDPMAKYLGVRPGQIMKITRASPTAGTYVMYRRCV